MTDGLLEQNEKPPKGLEWTIRHKSENIYNVCSAAIDGDDAWLKLSASYRNSGLKPVHFTIRDFRGKRMCDIERALEEASGSSDAYPMGRNFHDCLCDLCGFGLDAGMAVKTTKRI